MAQHSRTAEVSRLSFSSTSTRIVVGDAACSDDAFTSAETYPYSRHYRFDSQTTINYLRNSVKVVVDAYNGTTTFYVFDPTDPIIAAYRAIFPSLFKDASEMPPTLQKHVRYPELLLEMQAAVYGLYHMTDAAVFFNTEDLCSLATEVTCNSHLDHATTISERKFVWITLRCVTST